MKKCTCTTSYWFVGIIDKDKDENIVIYYNNCPIHSKDKKEKKENEHLV